MQPGSVTKTSPLQITRSSRKTIFFYERLVAFYDANPGLSTEGRGELLIYYRSDRRVAPEALHDFLREGLKILALFR